MKTRTYMPALTGVRALAAYLVFFHHNNRSEFAPLLQRITWEMHIGVNIFFVLSGFLIYYRYFQDMQLNRRWLEQYFINRFARIYPVLFILTILTYLSGSQFIKETPFLYGGLDNPLSSFLLNITLLKGFCSYLNFSGIAQSWTLTVEECFYVLAPLFFILLRKSKTAFVYLPLALFGTGMLLVHLLSPYRDITHGLYGDRPFMALYTFNGTCFEFFIGMILAMVVLKQDKTVNSKPVFTIAGGLLMLLSTAILCSFKQDSKIITGVYHPVGMIVDHLMLSAGAALLFYGLVKEQSLAKRFLSTRLMVLLGKSSYAFYLIHVGVVAFFLNPIVKKMVTALLSLFPHNGPDRLAKQAALQAIVFVVLMFLFLNLIAIAVFKWIEEPLNNAIRKYYKRRIAKKDAKKQLMPAH